MFLIMGINNGRKKLNFTQYLTCPSCGASCQIEIIMTFTYFMLFFIPLFRWNRRYFVSMPCCGTLYELDSELGNDIRRGRADHINPEDLNYAGNASYNAGFGGFYQSEGYPGESGPISSRANINAAPAKHEFADSYIDKDGLQRVKIKTCEGCGYETGDDFAFCPKCGKPL